MDEQKELSPPQTNPSRGAKSGSAGVRENGRADGRERDTDLDLLHEWGGCDEGSGHDSGGSRDEGVISSDCSGRARRLHGESSVVRRIVGAAVATGTIATATGAVATGTIATASRVATDAVACWRRVGVCAKRCSRTTKERWGVVPGL
jgi:hypothetical protein